MAKIDTPEAAMRLARAIASDISLYNEDKIVEGISRDNLFELVEMEIEEGLTHYKSRVSPQIFESTNFFYRAVVDILIKGKGSIQSTIW